MQFLHVGRLTRVVRLGTVLIVTVSPAVLIAVFRSQVAAALT